MCEPASKLREQIYRSETILNNTATAAIYKSHTQLRNPSKTTKYSNETKEPG